MPSLTLVGPLAIRPFTLEQICTSHQGHQHNYDHTTIVLQGRLRACLPDGDQEYAAGDYFAVPAKTWHILKALEPNTKYLCVFSHRDFDGLVTQEYVGNDEAYQEVDYELARESPRPMRAV